MGKAGKSWEKLGNVGKCWKRLEKVEESFIPVGILISDEMNS